VGRKGSELPVAKSISGSERMFLLSGGVLWQVPVSIVRDYATSANWNMVPPSRFTATPQSTSVLLMSDTSDVALGFPVQYVISGISYYGIVTEIAANASVTISGAPLTSSVTALFVGWPYQVLSINAGSQSWPRADSHVVKIQGGSATINGTAVSVTGGMVNPATYTVRFNDTLAVVTGPIAVVIE